MAKGQKYIALTTYLEKNGQDVIQMTFPEIEGILAAKLPDTAYKYPAYWSNSESQSLAFGWLNAGYRSQNLRIAEQTVEFVKDHSIKIPTVKRISIPHTKLKDLQQLPISHATLSVDKAIRCIRTYFDDTIKDPHGRYKSWVYCYTTFKDNRDNINEKTIDYLALHLAFYLASWGMYRGSSFLLQKDYRVHIPTVKIILDNRYTPLLNVSAESLLEDTVLDLLDEVSEKIRQAYAMELPSHEGIINNATDTLVTKILLGTLGCVPAYDRYYVQAVKQYGISSGSYNRYSVKDMANFYLSGKEQYEAIRHEINYLCGVEYPVMKIMDMCMWQIAIEQITR